MLTIITRKEAHEKGLKKFFTGKPCKHGHTVQRRVNSGACINCTNRYMNNYRKKFNVEQNTGMKTLTVNGKTCGYAVINAETVYQFLQGLRMTEKAGTFTYDQYINKGWTEEKLIESGYMK